MVLAHANISEAWAIARQAQQHSEAVIKPTEPVLLYIDVYVKLLS